MNTTRFSALTAFVVALAAVGFARAQDTARPAREWPSITVTGHGESAAAPDRAVVRLGAVAQAKEAAAAQTQVSKVVRRAIEQIQSLGIPAEAIQTSGLSLQPIFSQEPPPPQPQEEGAAPRRPRILGYQASNTISINVDQLSKIGTVIDTGVGAGANEIQGVSFELRDDTAARQAALRRAAEQARAKAQAIAAAMDVELLGLIEVAEEGAQVIRPDMAMGRVFEPAMATPVEPGQVRVDAALTVRYRFRDTGARAPAPAVQPGAQPRPERQ